jgi:hypothetical protein
MKIGTISRICGIIFLLIACSENVSAHVVVQELDNISKSDAAIIYLLLGFKHILPLGFDHILFVLSLFLLSPKLKPIIIQSTAFTIAHSVTLCLAAYQVINLPSRVIEPLIALSILYVAIENIVSPRLKPSRIGIVFLFGLVHGLGFAGALAEMGLPKNAYFTSLIMFNVGVEFGQLTVILLAWFFLAKWFSKKTYYRSVMVIPISIVIALIAGIMTIQRLFFP